MRALAVFRIGLFAAAMILPLAAMDRGASALEHEQRSRTPFPEPAVARARFPEQFDAYFRDRFGGRDLLIRWHHLFKFHVFRESPVPSVIVGSDGWLFYSAPPHEVDFRNFSGRWPHDEHQVEAWLTAEDARAAAYAAVGARYAIAVAPDKQSVYDQFVPARFGPPAPGVVSELSRLAAGHPRLQVFDLTPVLRQHRDAAPLYFKGDTHWNARGAFLAAQAITDGLRERLPSVGTIREADYVLRDAGPPICDLLNIVALGLRPTDRALAYDRRVPASRQTLDNDYDKAWEQPGSTLPRAVLIGDSFGVALAPILADAFSRLRFRASSLGGPDPDLVRRERPDVVVLITVERYLPKMSER